MELEFRKGTRGRKRLVFWGWGFLNLEIGWSERAYMFMQIKGILVQGVTFNDKSSFLAELLLPKTYICIRYQQNLNYSYHLTRQSQFSQEFLYASCIFLQDMNIKSVFVYGSLVWRYKQLVIIYCLHNIQMSKREIQEKELKAVLAKDIGAKNPIFSSESIEELHALFSLYADPRQRRADVRELLLTAGTLGLDSKYEFVFRLLHEIQDATGGNALDFEQFLKELTVRVGSPFSEEARRANFKLLDVEGKGELNLNDLRYINEQLKYNYNDDQLVEIIHSVGGFGAETISWDKFNKFIERKINRRRLAI